MPDVFISYDRTDAALVERIAKRLTGTGLDIFLDTADIRPFASIPDRIRKSLGDSRVLLAYYSRSYGSRRACQEEFTTAWLAGPERVLAVNPEPGVDHLAPREILDFLLPGHPASETALSKLVEGVRERVTAVSGTIDLEPVPERLAGVPAPTKFGGRWIELWQLHTVLGRGGTAVVHGVVDIGKTTLAHAYVQQYSRAYRQVYFGDAASAGPGDLVVFDDLKEPPATLPPGVACLLLTRDRRLAKLGASMELTDLREDELELDPALREVAEGSTGLAVRLSEQLSGSPESMLDRLYRLESLLLDPLVDRISAAMAPLGEGAWDVVRVLAATTPVPLTLEVLADVLAEVGGVGSAERFASAETVLADLLAGGLLVDLGLGEVALPRALGLALRKEESRPARAEQLRETAVKLLANRARPRQAVVPARVRSALDDEERRAAHRILNELTSRVPLRELPAGEGLLRAALTSLHTLFDRIRLIGDGVDPDALRPSTPVRPGLATLIRRLLDEILRPFLTYWHTRLDQHHELRPTGVGSRDHELGWSLHDQLRADLGKVRVSVAEVAEELAVLSGNPLR